jgi:hypothetical protein
MDVEVYVETSKDAGRVHLYSSSMDRPLRVCKKIQHILVHLFWLFLLHPMATVWDTFDLDIIHPTFKSSSEFDAKSNILLSPNE